VLWREEGFSSRRGRGGVTLVSSFDRAGQVFFFISSFSIFFPFLFLYLDVFLHIKIRKLATHSIHEYIVF